MAILHLQIATDRSPSVYQSLTILKFCTGLRIFSNVEQFFVYLGIWFIHMTSILFTASSLQATATSVEIISLSFLCLNYFMIVRNRL